MTSSMQEVNVRVAVRVSNSGAAHSSDCRGTDFTTQTPPTGFPRSLGNLEILEKGPSINYIRISTCFLDPFPLFARNTQ